MKFSIVDVFTTSLFGGNPAGIVLIPEGEDFPKEEVMVQTAAELRYSETAFIKRLAEDKFNIRYFTPASEVELCGHATIGSFYYLLKEGLIEANKNYINETLAGTLDVFVGENQILMDMAEPENFEEISSKTAQKELYNIMGIEAENQGLYKGNKDITLVPRKVSTGLVDIIMPVRNQEELEKIDPDFPALSRLSEKYNVVGVHAFTLDSHDGKIHARNFAPLYEIDEEAATGTSNGALTFYLYEYGIIEEGKINTVIQGEKMGRPSRIDTKVIVQAGKPSIKVGGFATTLVAGEIYF